MATPPQRHGHGNDHDHHHDHGDDHDHVHHDGPDHAEHGHGHHLHGGHHHHAVPAEYNRAFLLAILLNVGFVAVEFGYGLIAGSTALMADAGHNLSDVLGLVLAWGAAVLARKRPAGRYTYGLRSTSILAALANAMLLLVACGGIAWEALRRFIEPSEVGGMTIVAVAAAGIVVNGFSAWLFVKGSKEDLNIRGAYLHLMADAVVSLGVVIGGAIILATGWYWIDPLLSLIIVAVIVAGTWGLLRESVRLSLSAVPGHIDLDEVEEFLGSQPGVTEVQDLHIWGLSTTESALTVHLVMPAGFPGDDYLQDLAGLLKSRFRIYHSTFQIRLQSDKANCALSQEPH